jgi:hypothetical protein
MDFGSASLRHPAFLIDQQHHIQGSDVRVAGGQTTDASPTYRVEPGMVVVKESGDGLYYLSDGADGVSAGDINTAAVVTSKEAPDADWKDKTLTWSVRYAGQTIGGTIAGSGADDDTIAEWVTLLNADIGFAAHLVASDNGGDDLLVITTRAKGRVSLRVSMDLDTAFTTDDGASSSGTDEGGEADYRVITQHGDLETISGAATPSKMLATLTCGHFRESAMQHMSAEAKAVLEGRGSKFE